MNVFLPVNKKSIAIGLDGHYTLSGEYHGRKFIVDDINPLELRRSYNVVIDDIARRTAMRAFKAQPNKPFKYNPS